MGFLLQPAVKQISFPSLPPCTPHAGGETLVGVTERRDALVLCLNVRELGLPPARFLTGPTGFFRQLAGWLPVRT